MLIVCACGKELTLDDALAGMKIRCPTCQRLLVAGESEAFRSTPPLPRTMPIANKA